MSEIQRYSESMGGMDPDDDFGEWYKIDDVLPILERLTSLERQLHAAHMPCVDCGAMPTCDCAFDGYNVGSVARIDCLAAK